MKLQKRNAKGFTLMELMVVIVIIAILAAVAVPLYINYVNDAKRSEAKGAIGAIITAEQVYFQKNGSFSNDINTLNVDLSSVSNNWTVAFSGVSATGYTVTLTGQNGANGLTQAATYSTTTGTTWNPN